MLRIYLLVTLLAGGLQAKEFFNPKISLSGLFSIAQFSGDETLNFGAHDPKSVGFNVQNVELTLAHAVDPYLLGEAHLITLVEDGETIFELEEAFFQTTALPLGLQILGGHYFTRAGRFNAVHPHAWSFADQSIIHNRIYGGDGLRNPGVQLGWLVPAPFFWEITAGSQQATGETAVSFLGDEGGAPGAHHHGDEDHGEDSDEGAEEEHADEGIGGYPILEREVEGPRELMYHLRNAFSFDLSPSVTVLLGGDYLTGTNNKGDGFQTHIFSGDFFLKWKPVKNRLGYPFVKWQTEALWRKYEVLPDFYIDDFGYVSQVEYGFIERWVAGLRGEFAGFLRGEENLLREERARLSWNITFYPSEFSKIRLQHNFDSRLHESETLHSVFLQMEFNIGSHGAHTF